MMMLFENVEKKIHQNNFGEEGVFVRARGFAVLDFF
jgi:hypothetical protein